MEFKYGLKDYDRELHDIFAIQDEIAFGHY
jgi:TolB-like protein